jgi:hypothetical protein
MTKLRIVRITLLSWQIGRAAVAGPILYITTVLVSLRGISLAVSALGRVYLGL